MPEVIDLSYKAPHTIARFIRSKAFIRGLMGPIGSGKSVGSCQAIVERCARQRPDPADDIRYSRWAVIRNTYRELEDTTLQTWFEWFPMDLGQWKQSKMTHTLRINDMRIEVLFRALDRPDDVAKLLSLELTGAWINEAKEVPKSILDMLTGRVGRYPSKRRGGPSWSGIIMDTNPPDTEHWWYRLFEDEAPPEVAIFKQPSGRSAVAENVENLLGGAHTPDGTPLYYARIMVGKDEEWVRVYVDGEYGYTADGKPVHPMFSETVHVLDEEPRVHPRIPLHIGCDFGLTPAAVIAQPRPMGGWVVLDELTTEDTGAARFGELLRTKLNTEYPGMAYEGWGDPSGDDRSELREWETVFTVLADEGIDLTATETNDPVIRIEAVNALLKRLAMDGSPALLFSPKCVKLRKGLTGGYHFKRVHVHGEERFHEKPFKNIYSHVCEALQYLLLGAGEVPELLLHDASVSHRKPNVIRSIKGGSFRMPSP